MTAYPVVLADSATMLRRNLRRMRRYPSLTFFIAGIPVVFLLLFVYVFGGTLGAGLGRPCAGGRAEYIAYVAAGHPADHRGRRRPGHGDLGRDGHDRRASSPASGRWPSPASSVLTGHVIGSVIQTMLALAIVMVVAVLIGFRSTTGPVEWLAAAGAAGARRVRHLLAVGRPRACRPRASRPRATCRCSWCSCRS